VNSEPTPRSSPTPVRLNDAPGAGGADSPEPEHELLWLEVRCGREAPGLVRTALRETHGLGALLDDAILVASELVTNSVVHSGGSPADTIGVRAVRLSGELSISVSDPGVSGDEPHVRVAETPQRSGRGLLIVKQLARRWGFEIDRGCRVWADLAIAAGSS
jgi:anti-sigma regulatory factor (Ser/Thr protein kinase)